MVFHGRGLSNENPEVGDGKYQGKPPTCCNEQDDATLQTGFGSAVPGPAGWCCGGRVGGGKRGGLFELGVPSRGFFTGLLSKGTSTYEPCSVATQQEGPRRNLQTT